MISPFAAGTPPLAAAGPAGEVPSPIGADQSCEASCGGGKCKAEGLKCRCWCGWFTEPNCECKEAN